MSPITYTRCGDYLLPDIALCERSETQEPLTRYGFMRKSFLKEHRPMLYNQLLLTEELYPHLREIQQAASARLDTLMTQLVKCDPPPNKARDALVWTVHMNALRHSAEEVVVHELIYE